MIKQFDFVHKVSCFWRSALKKFDMNRLSPIEISVVMSSLLLVIGLLMSLNPSVEIGNDDGVSAGVIFTFFWEV